MSETSLPRRIVTAQEFQFHPFADVFPMMDETALAELAADIKAESQREPIYLWQDQIIDGRNRFEACKIAGVEPIFKRIEFPGGEVEALAYVVSRNLKRRHLNAPQRSDVIRKLRALPQWRDISNRAVAKQIGVSEATVRRSQGQTEPGLSASRDADTPQPATQHTLTVKRGEQEYRMRVERKPTPEPAPATESELVPLDPVKLAAVADANRAKALKADARYRDRREAAPAAVTSAVDEAAVEKWLKTALDSQRRNIAIKGCDAISARDDRYAVAVESAVVVFDKESTVRRLRFIRALMDKLTEAERHEIDAGVFARDRNVV